MISAVLGTEVTWVNAKDNSPVVKWDMVINVGECCHWKWLNFKWSGQGGLPKKITFHRTPNGGEGASCVFIWGKNILCTGTSGSGALGIFTFTFTLWTLILAKQFMTNFTSNVEAITVFYNLRKQLIIVSMTQW